MLYNTFTWLLNFDKCDSVSCSVVSDSLWPHSLPGSSVHGILQAKNTGMGRHSLIQGIFPPREQTQVSCSTGEICTIRATREALHDYRINVNTRSNKSKQGFWYSVTHSCFFTYSQLVSPLNRHSPRSSRGKDTTDPRLSPFTEGEGSLIVKSY